MTKKERLEYLKNWKPKSQDEIESYIEQAECDVDIESYSDNDFDEVAGYSEPYIRDVNSYLKGDD